MADAPAALWDKMVWRDEQGRWLYAFRRNGWVVVSGGQHPDEAAVRQALERRMEDPEPIYPPRA